MDRKDFWFRLQADFSPDPETGNYSSGSARSFHLLQASPDTLGTDLSQYPLTSPPESGRELSQHTIRNMDSTVNNETTSTNDTQEISSSQQESDGHLGDDANSTSSFQDSHQDEAVHSAIMEVSGELMLGRFSTHKHGSGGSESSDLSDDDHHRLGSGGVIAKYPESSTGLSDNDWNPYATESDTNQTPRSPRSNSDDQSQVGFVSKASLNIGGSAKPKESVATVSMTTGEVNVRDRKNGNEDSTSNANASEKLDILRYVVDGENDARRSPEAQSEYTDRTVSARQSMESGSYRSEQSGTLSGRPSSEFDQDNYRRESGESAQSYGSGTRSGRESGESQGPSGRSSRSDQEAGRQSVESQKSGRSEFSQSSGQSQPSQKSSARSAGSDRSERLDRLEETAGDNIKELIQFESAQRGTSSGEDTKKEESSDVAQRKQREDTSPVSRTRLTARLEPYAGPVRSSKSPEISSSAARSEDRYICVAERERLLSDSPEYSKLLPKHMSQDRKEDSEGKRRYNAEEKLERDPPKYSSSIVPRSIETIATRSPSQVSMRRVSDLFEETKRQSREAIQFQRPEPSGSEERFPLRERMALSKHDESFKMQDKSGASEGKLEKSRDSENARSLNSEEVARVLGKYADDETSEPMRKKEPKPKGDAILVSAFERLEQPAEIGASGAVDYTGVRLSDPHRGDESDDEIARRVRAILSQTDHLGGMKGYTARNPGEVDYVPRTIDYSLLQRDLQEIQDSLHDVPQPAANDSMHLLKARRDGAAEGIGENPREDTRMSLENTATTSGGRESGVSEYGRRLIWDHGADLQYDQGFGGEFMGTMATGDTLSSRMRGSGDTDSLTVTVRPDSAATNDTENDMTDFEGTRTLTGDDMSRAEKIVQQVMSRRAEGDLKESVEDIIARYRNERQDLFDRFQPTEPTVSRQSEPKQIDEVERREEKKSTPALANPDFALPNVNPAGDASGPVNGKKQPGLAERVYKILSADPDKDESDSSQDKSMAKKVYKILASDRPKEQVNGILTETLEVEHEMLKKMVSRPKDDSSLDDSGLNETADSFAPDDDNVRKQLEYSQFSSPGKGDKSEFTALREVTSAPYSALSNAKSLLSTQLKKMSERNFDKSVELRTPYRQTVECYPVYGMERQLTESGGQDMEDVREAWMPSRRSAGSRSTAPTGGRDRALDSERFYVTDRDREPVTHQRTYSDPFDTSPSRRSALRDGHTRSRSEEAVGISDISQYSTADQRPFIDDHCTPQQHRPQEWTYDFYTSPSDSSGHRRHSDSSDGNRWCFHSNQALDLPKDPEYEIYDLKKGSESHATGSKHSLEQERASNNSSPVKKLKQNGHQSRSRETKKKNGQVSFQEMTQMSKSLPSHYPGAGFVDQVPFSTDDVYDLLCRSQAQEEKLAELQKKLFGRPPDLSQNTTSCSDLSPRGQGQSVSGCYGYRVPPVGHSSVIRERASRGSYRGDGSPSPTESDTSGSRKPGAKIRPYRPAGSRDMYYTESGDETNESATTLESTHPGSDDAAPPYIPAHFLGSRRDDPPKHPTGIYSNKDKDILSTIDEQSVKDDKEKALSSSTGSGKGRLPASGGDAEDRRSNPDLAGSRHSEDKRSTVTSDTGYHSNPNLRSHSPFSQREAAGLDSGDRDLNRRNQGNGKGINPSGSENTISERPGFKTREEFQRDFERRERELKEVLARSRRPHTSVPLERDSLGASTRSDPGGALEEANPRWEYRESDQMGEFRPLEPEPAYPQDRVRHSRSRSDTDLVALSPTESQKYSSPMQPGTRFLELSTQPSPIFSHQDSLTREHRGRAEELPRVPPSREFPQSPPAQELPNVPDRRPATPPREYPVRPLEPGERSRPQEGQRSTVLDNPMGPVDIGADPRRLGTMRRPTGDGGNSGDRKEKRAKSPLDVRQKEMEAELEKLNRQLADQVADIKVGRPEEEYFEDNFPPSKKAQVLREVLEQEYQDGLPANINDMWSRFKEHREQSVTESSLNSTRLDTLSGLLHNPTQHAVHSFIKEKSVENVKQKQAEIEQLEREHEEKLRMRIEEKRVAEERASRERTQRRQELRAKSGSGISEEESNGSYSEILMEEERRRERLKRREEREGKRNKSPNKRSPRDGKVEAKTESLRKDRKAGKEGQEGKTKEQGIVTDIRARKNVNKHSESTDTLFSIPEDASFEQSPTKAESEMKARQKRHRHIIDPLMMKLRDKIKMQRDKIDKERRKELQRVQKLKKLELLLNAKKKGKLSDKAIGVELEDVSSTSCVSHSDGSHLSDSMLTAHLSTSNESDASSQSSTLIDSTIDSNIKLQVKKYPETEFRSPKKKYVESDSTETSDFSNIVVERITEKKGGKKKDKKSKEKKYKVDEFGRKIKKEKREKKQKAVFGVELSEKDIINQLQRYEQYMTPERKRRSRDASTMYPSPITVSPPSRRRMREVLMKSEAIQTSPSIRSTSPTHAYDEVPVAPVPYMSRQSGKTQRRRPSPSPNRSTQTSTSPVGRRSSRSPTTSANRKSSRSPVTFALRPTSKSPTSQRRRFIPPITRKQAQSPIWKPERELTTPPMNSMFTPEGDENADPARCSKQESATWFIPMKPGQPWRQPLKERQALAVRQEAWQPKSVSQSTWKDIVHGDVLKDHGDPNDISRDTKFDLDPEGNPIGEGSDSEESEVDIGMEKPLTKMSLQEAFEARKRATISRLRERQKRVTLAAEQRKMEDYLRLERDRLFNEERKKEANPEAHPYSGHLHRPARRIISKEEMKEMTEKKYKKLPEVVKAKQMKKVQDEYNLNRIKARLFNRRIQKRVLQKADKWGS
ncbi:uncharacterized protein LOC128211403 isoform X2 [Mya arenaria]|uniref:uncharacterized protein LOC128211403 isoform X2 n=1 Tax=Mya arenaria TaxID=6604 RepID=UPI0022E29A8E|nr:uncharacterized protein LOC128211403 isoform X2 [Mya arenaria]